MPALFGLVVCVAVSMQEAIQRALEENPELATQLDANYLNKVRPWPGLGQTDLLPHLFPCSRHGSRASGRQHSNCSSRLTRSA
jgi:hypothetical protein